MVDQNRVGDLEINQDLEYQKKTWKVERVGWGIMGLIALAGLLGVLGSGLLSHTTKGEKNDPLKIEFERFGRYQEPTELRVYLDTAAQQGDSVRVGISRDYLEQVQIQQATPEPESVEYQSDKLVYHFRVVSLNQPIAITFYLEPKRIGPVSGSVELEQGQTLQFNQFIYP